MAGGHATRFPPVTMSLLTALMLAAAGGGDAWALAGAELAQSTLTVRQRVIVRVPLPPRAPLATILSPMRWKARKGPRCVGLADIAGAAVVGPASVDILYRGGLRLRAELESACPALDFYGGFYLRPGVDGRICADRDAVHSRSGGECQIERFRKLVPAGRR